MIDKLLKNKELPNKIEIEKNHKQDSQMLLNREDLDRLQTVKRKSSVD